MDINRIYPGIEKSRCNDMQVLRREIKEYLEGKEVSFSFQGLYKVGRSKFERDVYKATTRIPRGKVADYKTLAVMSNGGSPRAVGRAMARNPYPLLIPCHRVINASGDIGGFQVGASLKRRLLELEGVLFDERGSVLDSSFFGRG